MWKIRLKIPPVVLFAITYAWAFAIMTLGNTACSCTTPSITKIVIYSMHSFHLYPLSYAVASDNVCGIVCCLFGEYHSQDIWNVSWTMAVLPEGCCNRVMNIIILQHAKRIQNDSVCNFRFFSYAAAKANMCRIICCLFSSDWGCHSRYIGTLGWSMSEGCCNWIMNLIITHLTDTILWFPMCVQ